MSDKATVNVKVLSPNQTNTAISWWKYVKHLAIEEPDISLRSYQKPKAELKVESALDLYLSNGQTSFQTKTIFVNSQPYKNKVATVMFSLSPNAHDINNGWFKFLFCYQ